jgi:CheY-like chemotaxis protein
MGNEKEVEILLVEDSEGDLELTLHALRKNNLANTIHVARDGEEALDFLFDAQKPAHAHLKMILLDLKLPKVHGLDVLKKVKSDPRTHAIPVVVLTSSREDRDMVRSYDLGVNSYLQKPVDFDQFQEMVKLLGRYWLVINQPPPPGATPNAGAKS